MKSVPQKMKFILPLTSLLLLLSYYPKQSCSKSILGIDLGSLYMKVALVQRNSPLEIVTNYHSKRKTEQMVLFDNDARRLYGADASSMIGRKPLKTPTGMSIMLGRDEEHPTVKVLSERHYPLGKTEYNETRSGVCLTISGQSYTPEELVSMVLSHARDITTAYGAETSGATSTAAQPFVKDCVLTVPSFFTQHERRALLDAAALADLNVLSLIDETTAAALHFGIDRVDTEPKTVLFYNMGNSALQVSIVKYFSYEVKTSKFGKDMKTVGAFEVLGKGWDSTLGGDAFDARLVDFMVEEFNEIMSKKLPGEKKDVRNNVKAMTKLRLQANKAKHVLSANSDFPIFIDGLMNDIPYQSHISRAKLEELVHDLLKRASEPIHTALKRAKVTLDEIDMIELIGGGMRVPSVQTEIKNVLNKELGMHINSDESMALGAAFHGANVSTAFRVRHVGMSDVNPFEIGISLSNLKIDKSELVAEGTEVGKEGEDGEKKEEGGILGSLFGIGSKKTEEANAAAETEVKKEESPAAATTEETKQEEEEEEEWSKNAILFASFGRIGVKKSIAFSHNKDVLCSIDYTDSDILPEGTEKAIERYNITGVALFAKEMAAKNLTKPKVNLQFELSSSGITRLIKAEASCEEMVMVDEQVEVDDDEEEKKENETITINATGDASVDSTEVKDEEKAADKEESEAAKEKDDNAEDKESPEDKKEETDSSETNEEAAKTKDAKDETASSESKGGENATKDDETKSDDKATDKDTKTKKRPPKKKKKFITVQKEKKRVHKKALTVKTYHVGRIQPYSESTLEESKAKLALLAAKDKALQELEEMKNKLESYIYYIKNKLSDKEEEIAKVSTEEQRTALHELASSTEDWLYEDGYDADLETYKAKYDSLYEPADGTLFFRLKEATDRPAAILAMQTKMTKVKELMEKWKVTMPQITDDERADVLAKVEKIEEWMKEMEEKQSKVEPYDTPAFNSTEVPLQSKSLYTLVTKLGKRPKPKPKKVPKNETKSDDDNKTTTDDANATAADGTKAEGDEKPKEDEKSNEADDKSKEGESESSTATDEDKDKKEDSTSSDAEDDSDDPEL